MKTKHLFTAIALPALFAACTAEDIATGENIVKNELDNRPVVEGVTLSMGDAQSRAALENYNKITFEEGDKLGVALVDVYNTHDNDPVKKYNLLTNSINTNYIFTADSEGTFSSEAAMVEGNYVFYYPYNTQRTRNQILTNLPKTQALTVMADGKYTSYPSVLEYSIEKGAPIAVAYDFISASDAGNTLNASLKQIYATPLITLENTAVKGGTGEDKDDPISITIKQIILSKESGSFVLSAPLKFADASQTAYTEADGTASSIVSALFDETIPSGNAAKKGPWEKSILGRKTAALLGGAVDGGTSTSITLTLEEPVTVPAEGTFSFYAVLPSGDYTTENLKAVVYNAEGKSQELALNAVTLTAGQRYPEEEFNSDEIVNADVKGVSLSTIVDNGFSALAGQLVSSVEELISAVRNAEAGEVLTLRVGGTAVINSRVANLFTLSTSTKASAIKFVNEVAFDGASITWKSAHDVEFAGDVTVNAGAVVKMEDSNSDFGTIINNGTINYYQATVDAIANAATLNLIGAAATTTAVTNTGIVNVKANGDDKVVETGDFTNGNNTSKVAATLNVETGVKLNTNVTNCAGSTLNNLGIVTRLQNNGVVNNGSETNYTADIQAMEENKTVATGYTAKVNNYGKLYTDGNSSVVEMKNINATATVYGGIVMNDVLAYVVAYDDAQVTYTMTGAFTADQDELDDLATNSITHLILDDATMRVVSNLNFQSMNLIVNGNVTINSGKGANAGLLLNSVASVTINDYSKLTVNAGVDFPTVITPAQGTNASYVNNNN